MLEPTTPTPQPRRRRRALVAGVSVLAAATAAVAITAGSGGTDNRLSLVSGGTVADAESARNASPTGAPAPMANGDAGEAGDEAMSSDAKMSIAPWYQTTYEIDGNLAELGGEGRAWRFVAPEFDGRDAARMAAAFGLTGTPVERDGGWVLETSDGHFSAYPSTDSWSINFNRNEPQAEAGSDISAAGAEAAARALLDELGVLDGRWDVQVSQTEIGVGYGCAVAATEPAMADADLSSEEMKAREIGMDPSTCPPPPPPVSAQHVAFYPILDGMRPDWSPWGVTVAAGGEIHSLYGTWTELREAGTYKLRSVDAALDEIRNPTNYAGEDVRPMPAIATDDMATTAVAPDAPVSSAGATEPADSPATGGGTSGSEPAVAVDLPAGMPAPASCDPAADCGVPMVPVEQKVTITGVSRSLALTSVWTDGTVQTHLVPAYRFTGTWSTPEMGDRWETTVIALHPDAIAPPPPVASPTPGAQTKVRDEG